MCFLNFHKDYKNHFTAVIYQEDSPKFSQPPEKLYLNKKVRIRGRIKHYTEKGQDKPEIIIKSPEQIEIVK